MAEAALPILLGGAASALGNYFGAQTAANAAKQELSPIFGDGLLGQAAANLA